MAHFGGYVLHNISLMHEEAQMPNMICSLSSLSLFFFFLFCCCQGGDGEYMSHKSVKGFLGAMHCTISDWRMKTHGCHTWFVPSLVSFFSFSSCQGGDLYTFIWQKPTQNCENMLKKTHKKRGWVWWWTDLEVQVDDVVAVNVLHPLADLPHVGDAVRLLQVVVLRNQAVKQLTTAQPAKRANQHEVKWTWFSEEQAAGGVRVLLTGHWAFQSDSAVWRWISPRQWQFTADVSFCPNY